MVEEIYNLFVYVEDGVINEIGAVSYEAFGSDEDMVSFLRERVSRDFQDARRFRFSSPQTYEQYMSLVRLGRHGIVFEEAFEEMGASADPLSVITPIDDGVPRIDIVTDQSPLNMSVTVQELGEGNMEDYLFQYQEAGGFNMPKLIDDDFVGAIRSLFNERRYISSAKLLLSMIDTLGYLEYGDASKVFHRWLETNVDLQALNVTADELWEMRNSYLHMTNLDSRKHRKGDVARMTIYLGERKDLVPPNTDEMKHLDLWALMQAVFQGIGVWCASYNEHPEKFERFVERYDRIVSDVRMLMRFEEPNG